jgi:hypothetical protein
MFIQYKDTYLPDVLISVSIQIHIFSTSSFPLTLFIVHALSIYLRLERGGPCWRLKLRWMGTQRVQRKEEVLPWLVRWACRTCTRDFCSALATLFGSLQYIFFPAEHYFHSFVPITQQADQAAVLGHLSLSVSLCLRLLIWLNLLFVQVRCTHPDERIPGAHLGCGTRQQRGSISSQFSGSGAFWHGSGSADP